MRPFKSWTRAGMTCCQYKVTQC